MRKVLLFHLACALPFASAQENISYASLGGHVTDPSGGAVANALVKARKIATNVAVTALTDPQGRYRIPYLSVGQYEINIHKDGFADSARTVSLTVGSAFELPVQLTIKSQESTMLVGGETPLLETSRTQIAGTVPQAEVAGLPLNGRNFLDLALLIPGVSPTNTASNQLFAETSGVPGQGLSIGSQRNFSNSFIVDGLSANDDAAGLSGMFYSLDVVQEFQVVTSGGHAELGRALGGYVNMVTKSGTNALHGTLYGYFRNQRFNAANPLSNTKLPATQAQYGASLGGPVIHDRTFYFANFEQRELNQSGLITIAPANASAINARLAAAGYQGGAGPIGTGIYPNPVHTANCLAKADHQIRLSDQFSIRYSLYDVHSRNTRGAGALSAVSASANLDDTDQTVALSNIYTFSPRMVNETHAQFTRSNLQAPPTDQVGPAVSISGVASFGTLSGAPTARIDNLTEIADSLSYQSGSHAVRAGADFLYNDLLIAFPRSVRGSYAFSSLANFLSGTYNNAGYTQTFGNSAAPQTNPNIGFYAQDEWKVNSSLTLNAGVRYDLQFLKSISTDGNNISPRAGFAWTPFTSRRTVIRGGYGIFYDRVPLRALANALLSSGNTTTVSAVSQLSVSLSPAQAGAPVCPNILPVNGLPSGVLVNFTTMDRHLRNAYSEQGSLEIEHQFGEHSTLSAAYEHLRGLHLIVSVNRNAPSCVAAGTNNGCRPNAGYANNSQYSSLADSHYDALHISFVRRPVRWGNYRISYSYSKALDNVGEFFFSSPIDNFNIWRDYGRSDDDQRHRLVFDGMIHRHGFQLSGMLQYYSALPLNVTSGLTTVQGTTGRPVVNGDFIGRNTGAANDSFGINARLSRAFRITEKLRLEAMVEAFNLLNHRNNLTKNGVFGAGLYPQAPSPNFGQVTAVNDPRVMQTALRLTF
jgi:hypothetical protein